MKIRDGGYSFIMAAFGTRDVSVSDTSSRTTVPQNPIAQLMYYLNCIISISNVNLSSRLTNFHNWNDVQPNELAEIMALCVMLDPRELSEKGILVWDREGRVCNENANRFIAITIVNSMALQMEKSSSEDNERGLFR
jgi:hypothetical protein